MNQQATANRASIAPASVLIRTPTGPERAAWRTLLPNLSNFSNDLLVQVAVDPNQPHSVLGAAAVCMDPNRWVEQAAPMDWQLAPHVPQETSTMLLKQLCQALLLQTPSTSSSQHPLALFSWPWFEQAVDADATKLSDNFAPWQALGFEPWQHERTYATTIQSSMDGVAPVYERLVAKGRIPADAKIVPLVDAPMDQVIQLHVQHLGGHPQAVRALVTGQGADPIDTQRSLVAMQGSTVLGLGLVRTNLAQRSAVFDSVCVDPNHRGRWVLPWLRHAQLAIGLRDGFVNVRYFALDQHTDTQAAADRLGSELVNVRMRAKMSLPTA